MDEDVKSLVVISSFITALIGFALVDEGQLFYASWLLVTLIFNFLAIVVVDRLNS